MQTIIILETFKDFFSCKLSWPQIIIIPKLFKASSACKVVFDTNHHCPENIQTFFDCKIVLAANHFYPEIIQNFSRLQNCLRRKSSLSRNYSKFFSPAKLSKPHIIIILKIFKELFACKIVLAANHFYPEIIQRLFRLQNRLSRKSSLS